MSKMDAERLDKEKLLKYFTVEEKLRMLSGDGMWHTFGAADLPRVRMADGPTGLRPCEDGMPAPPCTCYPVAGMLANSWDTALLYNVGAEIGREATAIGVNLLLAPGINIKRNPFGGRNFEYYSEDPLLSGVLGKAFVNGVQSTGVGATLKHFAANNCETNRMYSDSIIDERTLREIYLKPFEIAVTAKPAAIMCAYNKVNGEYACENAKLLRNVLRDEWNYDGVTVSDWGAVHNRVKSLNAGLDLEMPDSLGLHTARLKAAYDSGELTDEILNQAVSRILELVDNVYLEPCGDNDAEEHDRVSYNAAVESVTLLKNDSGLLPLTKDMRVAVVGDIATDYPIQGGGSSHVTALKAPSPLDAFSARGIEVSYFKGFGNDPKQASSLKDEALSGAVGCDAVIVYAGGETSTEGCDRTSLSLPDSQNELITALTLAGHRVIVMLCVPGPCEMPWAKRVRAIVYNGLCGQNSALAGVDVLYGRVNPRGKLAETFPVRAEDAPSQPPKGDVAAYTECGLVGYRYYDTSCKRALFPFGHGLSFSNISYDNMRVKRLPGNNFEVDVTLGNNSVRDAYEIVQVYVSNRTGRIFCPEKQLAGFAKVLVEGESSTVAVINIGADAFKFFDTQTKSYRTCDGEFAIMAAASSTDVRKQITVKIDGDYKSTQAVPDCYSAFRPDVITVADFENFTGVTVPQESKRQKPFTLENCVADLKKTLVGKIVSRVIKNRAKAAGAVGSPEYNAFYANAMTTPLSSSSIMSEGALPPGVATGIVHFANKKFIKGVKSCLSRGKEVFAAPPEKED